MRIPLEDRLPYAVLALLVLAVFYGIYFAKVLAQKRRGIQTRQIGRRKEKSIHTVEVLMSVATLGAPVAQLLSIAFGWSHLPANARFTGFCVGILGDAIFLLSVLCMKDSWRAGIPDKDKTELVTTGIYRFSRNPAFFGFDLMYVGVLLLYGNLLKDSNALVSFLFYTLEPLTAEKWRTRDFGGSISTDYPGAVDNASLEFVYSLTVQNADTLTVGAYNAACLGVTNGLQSILQDKTKEQLKNDSAMQEAIDAAIENLKEQWDTDDLQVSIKYFFMPLSEPDAGNGEQENCLQDRERRENPNGTEEDYRSLLQLKTTDYQRKSVADFNMELLKWADNNPERMARIMDDAAYQDFSVDLSSDELSFVTLTAWLSRVENGKHMIL